MKKCAGELIFIGAYLIVLLFCIFGLIYSINYGKPLTIAVELAIAYAADQAKSLPAQLIIYWTIIRRFGKYENVEFEEWNDEKMVDAGTDPSLLFMMRKTLANFLEHRLISRFILGMVILLCIVIFSELSLSVQIDSSA